MQLTNYKWDKPVFHQAATYRCKNCCHSCEVYSNFEWVQGYTDACHKCGTENTENFDLPVFLYRCDCYPQLSTDPANLPEEKQGCTECYHVKEHGGKYHWTELELFCEECENGRMAFSEFTDGMRMGEFIEIAIEESKLKAPAIRYTCNVNGSEYYLGNTHDIHFPELAKGQDRVRVTEWEFRFSAT